MFIEDAIVEEPEWRGGADRQSAVPGGEGRAGAAPAESAALLGKYWDDRGIEVPAFRRFFRFCGLRGLEEVHQEAFEGRVGDQLAQFDGFRSIPGEVKGRIRGRVESAVAQIQVYQAWWEVINELALYALLAAFLAGVLASSLLLAGWPGNDAALTFPLPVAGWPGDDGGWGERLILLIVAFFLAALFLFLHDELADGLAGATGVAAIVVIAPGWRDEARGAFIAALVATALLYAGFCAVVTLLFDRLAMSERLFEPGASGPFLLLFVLLLSGLGLLANREAGLPHAPVQAGLALCLFVGLWLRLAWGLGGEREARARPLLAKGALFVAVLAILLPGVGLAGALGRAIPWPLARDLLLAVGVAALWGLLWSRGGALLDALWRWPVPQPSRAVVVFLLAPGLAALGVGALWLAVARVPAGDTVGVLRAAAGGAAAGVGSFLALLWGLIVSYRWVWRCKVRRHPAEEIVQTLCLVLANVEAMPDDWRRAWVKRDTVANIEWIAQALQREFAATIRSGDNWTATWFAQRTHERAAALRQLKQQVLLPHDGAQERLRQTLAETLVHAAGENWGQLATGEYEVARAWGVRAAGALRAIGVVVFPLLLVGALQVLPFEVNEPIKASIATAAIGWAVVSVLALLEPNYEKRIGAAKTVTELFKGPGGGQAQK